MTGPGPAARSGAVLADEAIRRLTWAGFLANGVGAVITFLFVAFLAPGQVSSAELEDAAWRTIPLFLCVLAFTLPFGRWWAARLPMRPIEDWLRSGRDAGDAERRAILRYPLVWAIRSAAIWLVGALSFGLINVSLGAVNSIGIFLIVALGGITACALQYLVVERIVRPITARALAGGAPPPDATPGVSARVTMTWMLGTGIALLGIGGLAVAGLVVDLDPDRVSWGILFLAAGALGAGLFAMLMTARSVAGPLVRMSRALETVETGDLTVRVPVDDGSEIGLVQAGFNSMVEGLAEREKIREAFGTYMDPAVAEHVLRESTSLEGEEIVVTAMFVDIRDFTGFAERNPASLVVATLNGLFEQLVPVIRDRGGHIDKFVGDGFLAVFGAPRRQANHADQAFAAAIEIADRVERTMSGKIAVGIGLNTGSVVAGNVGGGGRFDFSVIGDVINVAARVEAATRETGDTILVSEHTLKALGQKNIELEERSGVELKGKRDAVAVYAPLVPSRNLV